MMDHLRQQVGESALGRINHAWLYAIAEKLLGEDETREIARQVLDGMVVGAERDVESLEADSIGLCKEAGVDVKEIANQAVTQLQQMRRAYE